MVEAARLVKVNPLLDKYLQALTAFSTELTKGGKLDDAAAVKGVAEEIAKARANGVTGGSLVHTSGNKKLTGQERSFNNSLGMKFVPVPGTKVLFCIHETRLKVYAAFAAAIAGVSDGWKKPQREGVPVGSGSENDPVVMISCEDATAFCAWLSKQEGHTYRLPTDQEWSHAVGIAAKESATELPGALDAKIRNLYPWGDRMPPPKRCANLRDESYRAVFKTRINVAQEGYDDGFPTTAPVMSFTPNSIGLYDLAGNAWEWCDSWIDDKQTAKVLRGGSWAEGEVLSSRRISVNTAARSWEYGFRCVVEPDK